MNNKNRQISGSYHLDNCDEMTDLEALLEVIERAWYDAKDASVVDRLAAQHPEYSSELYEFLALLVADELEPAETEEESSIWSPGRNWLENEGFELVRQIAVDERNRTSTKTTITPPISGGRARNNVQLSSMTPRSTSHNQHFNEAVVIGVLVKQFGKTDFPLGRKRRTKFAYLLHRHCEGKAEGFEKKAAGPYNSTVRYGGAEKIAINNGYVCESQSGKHKGFIAGPKTAEAEAYFKKWYGASPLTWLDQFRFKTNEELELITTVDMAMAEVRAGGAAVSLQSIKAVIAKHPQWSPKLKREIFSDENIVAVMTELNKLLGS